MTAWFRKHRFHPGWFLTAGLMMAAAWFAWQALMNSQGSITFEWKTASELDVAGYHIYRSSGSDPEYRLTTQLIPPAPDAKSGGDYIYEDRHVIAGKTYNYRLETVNTDGTIERGQPIAVKALPEDQLSLGISILLVLASVLSSRLWSSANKEPASHAG